MRNIGALSCCLTLVLSTAVDAAEPPLRLEVRVGDSRQRVDAGTAAQIVVDGKPVTLQVDILPTRRFNEAGLRFEYPAHMPWEHDPPSMWTLDGNNATVIIHRGEAGDDSSADDLLDNMESSLKSKTKPRRSDVELGLRSGTVRGRVATMAFSSSRIRTEAYVVGPASRPVLLMLQDALDDNGKATAEFIELRRLLVDTLEVSLP